jgi:peptidoglycan hydrolase-like protein with peptidoglycan-binding domain
MAPRVISVLAILAIVATMIAPALAQTTGTGSAPKTGAGSSTPSAPAAPSATQLGAPTQGSTPAGGTGAGATGKANSGTNMGQSGTPAPGAGGMSSKPTTGMNGGAGFEQVKAIQKALQDKGMDPGAIDGIMGPKTTAALKAFQKDQKLTESGRLDDQTRDKLGVSR